MAIRKPGSEDRSGAATPALVQCSLAAKLPTLLEFLTDSQYDDGTPRQLPSLTVFAEPGCIKAALNDRDTERVAFVTAPSLLGVLEALEEGLVFNNLDWRQSRSSKPRRN